MIIFLYGPDSYRRNKKLHEVLAEYRKKHAQADMLSVDLEDNPEEWESVRDFLAQPSMFVDVKLAIIRESRMMKTTNGNAKKEKEWIKLLKSHLENPKTFVVISDTESPTKAYSFLVEVPAKAQRFEELSGAALDLFITEEARVQGVALSPSAFEFLKAYALHTEEGKSWRIVHALEIASLFPSRPISKEHIAAILEWRVEEEMFRIAKAILGTRDTKKGLALLEQGFLQGEDAAYLFNSLVYQARGKEIITFADYDIAVKSGKLEYEEALTDFVMR